MSVWIVTQNAGGVLPKSCMLFAEVFKRSCACLRRMPSTMTASSRTLWMLVCLHWTWPSGLWIAPCKVNEMTWRALEVIQSFAELVWFCSLFWMRSAYKDWSVLKNWTTTDAEGKRPLGYRVCVLLFLCSRFLIWFARLLTGTKHFAKFSLILCLDKLLVIRSSRWANGIMVESLWLCSVL